ncbi:ABC transporter substrate-binding protein [Micromonospora sp. NBC_01813]|uniref:ABC transporter substrate-binding protein n=1 Tax=Micromonospora sp. NBC_01813 TaxID=2975988 RepID=UPI002DD8FEF4|nr:ABC transporter substrate-binding protein [Micromonospora sp. NBC_01813]WSA12266.1 ABC transporter substrate-binding protein [Micromonospora sp. NBC_01813]
MSSSPISTRGALVRALTVALLVAIGLTACATVDGEEADDEGRPVEISVFWWGAERRAELTQQALDVYAGRHPGVTFKVTWQGNSGYYDRLSSEAAGGNAPDLFQIDDNYLTEYAERNVVLDLTPYVEDGELDLSGFPSSLVQYGQIAGRTVGVAAAANTPGMVYNKTLLAELDVEEPTIGMTYDELIDWAAEITALTGGEVAGTMDPSGDYKALWLWLRTQDKELYQGRQLGFGVQDLTAWFELWAQARAVDATPTAELVKLANSGDVTQQLVATRDAATSFMWSNQLAELQKHTSDDLGVVSYPGDPQGQWARASMYWSGFRGTRHPDVVVDVIDFLVNDPQAGRILGTERGLSSNLDVREIVQSTLADEKMKASVAFEQQMAELFGSAPVPPPRGHTKIRSLLIIAAESVQGGQATPQEAAERFVAQANADLSAS